MGEGHTSPLPEWDLREADQRDDDGGNSLILALKKVTHKIVRTNLTVIAELTILPVAGQALSLSFNYNYNLPGKSYLWNVSDSNLTCFRLRVLLHLKTQRLKDRKAKGQNDDHTWYLSFSLHRQNFWRIKFTPKKHVNYDKIHSKLPIFCVITAKYTVNCQFFALNL